MARRKSKSELNPKDIRFVSHYPITEYQCGLHAGNRVQLKKDLAIRDYKGRPTGTVHLKGEVWTVLPGCDDGRIDVWLRQPDGNSHTWDDDAASIDEWFEVIE